MTIDHVYAGLLAQLATESYLEGISTLDAISVAQRLRNGNNRPEFANSSEAILSGKSRMTQTQIVEFQGRYQILDQWSDDPRRTRNLLPEEAGYRAVDGEQILANTGFSATLIRDIDPASSRFGSVTLSFRSTEFAEPELGGDRNRDGFGADVQLGTYGLALAQIDAMERYYDWLESQPHLLGSGKLYVTGYSLGGHLALVFAEMHPEVVEQAYVFNAPGRGSIGTAASLQQVLDYYRLVLEQPDLGSTVGLASADADWKALAVKEQGKPFSPVHVYQDPRARWAAIATQQHFQMLGATTVGASVPGTALLPGTSDRVTGFFGHGDTNDGEWVSKLGFRAPASAVFIEDQPLLEGFGGILPGSPRWYDTKGDFATTHSITLLADSLAVVRALAKLDRAEIAARSDYHVLVRPILSAASYEAASSTIGTSGHAEFDSLENVVRALGKLLLVPLRPMSPGRRGGDFADIVQRDIFHDNLQRIVVAIGTRSEGREFGLQSLNDTKAPDLRLRAATGADTALAYRFALLNGQSFIVSGFDYGIHNRRGELDFHDATTRHGDLTAEWLRDRSLFLEAKMTANVLNKTLVENRVDDASWELIDVASAYAIKALQLVPGPGRDGGLVFQEGVPRRMSFGSDGADYVAGTSKDDRLYAGRGTDVLYGGDGDDYLEGGEGLDIYRYGSANFLGVLDDTDGTDIIRDTDGRGVLRYVFNGRKVISSVIFDASVKLAAARWVSADGRFSYEKVETDLVVTILGEAGGGFTLRNFRDGDFGIRLAAERRIPDFTKTLFGDRLPQDFDPATPGIQSRTGPDGRVLYGDLPGDPVNDLLIGEKPQGSGFPVVYSVPGPDSPGERIEGLDGNDILIGDPWDAHVHGSWMPDVFPDDEVAYAREAYANRDWLLGGPGRDAIFAGGGDDLVEGGADGVDGGVTGGDTIDGGPGDDVLYGDQRIAIADAIRRGETDAGASARGDAILGGAGADWVIGSAGRDALMGGGGDDLIVGGAGDDDIVGDAGYFAASFEWSVVRDPSAGAEVALIFRHFTTRDVSPAGRDIIHAGAGDDWVFGEGGDDLIDGGSGADVLRGGGGADVLLGGDGRDRLFGDGDRSTDPDGGDYLDGGAGDDILEGGDGDDVLVGGPGMDVLIGGPGRDFYLFERGDGEDVIQDVPPEDRSGERSVVILGPGASRRDVKFRVGSLAIDFGPSDPDDPMSGRDVIHIEGFDPMRPGETPVLEELRFADGDIMRFDEILAQGFDIDGTESDDGFGDRWRFTLSGTAVTDRIRGLGGRDDLRGYAGDDVLDGGDGNDQLNGGTGDDILLGGSGNDGLIGESGQDHLEGGLGDDTLNGGSGDDLLIGGAGRDLLLGGEGDDTYLFEVGGGSDVVRDGAGRNRLRFGSGVASADLTLSKVPSEMGGTHWLIGYGAAGDDLIIRSDGEPGLAGLPLTPVVLDFSLEFADGSEIRFDELIERAERPAVHSIVTGPGGYSSVGSRHADRLWGGRNDDILRGMGGNDELGGAAGNDQLFGGDGDDVLVGGGGDDYLDGGAGVDVIRLTLAMGIDMISGSGGEADVLEFGPDFRWEDTEAWRRGEDLVVRHRHAREGVILLGYFDASGSVQQTGWQVRDGAESRPLSEMLPAWAPAALPDGAAAWADAFETRIRTFHDRTLRSWGYVLDGDTYSLTYQGVPDSLDSSRTITTHEATARLDPVTATASYSYATFRVGLEFEQDSEVTHTVTRSVTRSGASVRLPLGSGGDMSTLPVAVPGVISQTYLDRSGASQKVSGYATPGVPYVFTSPVDGQAWYFPRSVTITPAGLGAGPGDFTLDVTDTYVTRRYAQSIALGDFHGTDASETLDLVGGVRSPGLVPYTGWSFALVDAGAGDDLVGGTLDAIGRATGAILTSTAQPIHIRDDDIAGRPPVHRPGAFLYGNAGQDWLVGGVGDDVLMGGAGDDVLVGNGGNDIYVLEAGGGRDTVYDAGVDGASAHREDVLVLPAGVTFSDLTFAWEDRLHVPFYDEDWYLAVQSMHAVLTVSWWGGDPDLAGAAPGQVDIILPQGAREAGTGIDFFRFSDGSEVAFQSVLRLAPGHALDPSEMGETLSGTEGRDQISGEDGDDIIHGGAGPDILIGGAGWDRLHGGHGDDELYGGEFVYAPVGEQTAWVGDLWDGGNVFHGGPGDDTIHAGGGSDIFEVNRGDGWDLITDLRHTDVYGELLQDDPARFDDWLERTIDPYAGVDAHRSQLVNAQDILRFGPGIRPEHILVTRDDRDLVVRYEGPFTGVSFHNWFMSAENQLSRIVFEDGTVWSQADLLERSGLEYHPDVVNRAPVPGAPVAALQVRSGDRTIWDVPETAFRNDDAGDVLWFRLDALPGATRPDWVRETRVTDPQTGGSRYLFELAPTSEDAGTHEFHLIATDRGGLSAAVPFVIDVLAPNRAPRLVATLPDLTAGPIGAGARPLNLGAFTDDDGDPLRFDLRTLSGAPLPHWLDADLLTGTLTFAPASADAGTLELELSATDSHGASSALRFSVRVGAEFSGTSAGDVLLGSPGDDVFAGGPGNDRLSGEAGDDRYRYAPGDGLDTIIDSAGDDGILFSSAVDPSRVVARIAQSPERTVLTVRLTDAYGAELSNQGVDIVLPEPASGHEPFASPVEYVQFGSGVRTSMSDLLARPVTVVVPDGLELYLGNRDDETILAGAGTRRIAGRGGHDVIVAGGEALVASGGPGQDHLIGGDGADRLLGDADHDILSGGSGDDYLSGGYNNDLLLGGHGDDTLVGEHGADFLVGGPGNDRLVNVSVVDSVAFNRGDGADRIEFAAVGLGALSFGGGIQLRDLSMAREGSDLVIRTGGDDSVTFVDWYRTTRVSPLKVIQIIGSPADQIAGSSPMAGARAEWFDLRGLVGAFDAAQARAPTLEPWALADAAAAFHLGGSDERAYANDLAWWYGGLGAPDGTLSIAQAREGLRVDRMIFPKTVNPLSGDGPWVS